MPLFEYECPNGHVMDKFFTSYRVRTQRAKCVCGKMGEYRISAPNVHTIATFSAGIDDAEVKKSIACDGSYLDPNLSFNTDGTVTPITSARQRERLIAEKGLFEKPPSEKAKDVQRLKRTKPVHVLPSAKKTAA